MKKWKYGLKKAAAMVLSAAMAVTMLPAQPAGAANQESKQNDNDLRLWYTQAAADSYSGWHNWSLPLGNSAIGASVFGRVSRERIQLTEKSLWSGGPSESRPNYNGGNIEANGNNGQTMKQIQEAFANGDTATANSLCSKLTGVSDDAGTQGYGYFLSYGNMYLDFHGMSDSDVENYERDLDLSTAVSSVGYDYDGVHYTREYFVSYPDNVLVTRLTADKKGALNVDVQVEPDNTSGGGPNNNQAYQRTWDTQVEEGRITIAGKLSDNQMRFNSQTQVINEGGSLTDDAVNGKVCVSGADSVVILTSIGTDYKNEYPAYRTGESDAQVDAKVGAYVDAASEKTYDALKEDHVADYREIFDRVDLNLGQTASQKTTDALLKAYNAGSASEAERRNLEVLLFQYGRYLTIASSRSDGGDENRTTLPSNLQGIWVGGNNSPWHSDYHMNVNLQMNYWPTYSTNMAECAEPLIDYVDSLREPGRETARIYAGIESTEENPENGFMAHTQNTPFGWTCPGWSFDWGWSPAAVPWILQNCWEYYEYTGDLDYMRTKIYPMMKEEAVLYSQMLIEDPDGGGLVCSPAYSPEHGPRTNGNTYEQTLIWQLFEDVITAGKLVGEDASQLKEWQEIQDNLKGPIEIGASRQIKEWYIEEELYKDADGNSLGEGFNHRHMSHLLGLFPGDLISVETPELLQAAIVSLENRVDKSTGWGMGQRINSWARTGNGDHAYKLITDLFNGGILENLWDTHSPFQIDGNFGMTSGVAEMLLQSNMGYINILPALPSAWADGQVEGLVARGNFEISMKWAEESPYEVTILSKNGGEAEVQTDGIAAALITDQDGNPIQAEILSADRVAFDTEKGQTYTITNIPKRASLKTPEGLTATRSDEQSVNLNWDALEGEEVTYTLYRQADDGDVQKIAENLTETSYVDDTADEALGTLRYQVQATATRDGKRVDSQLSGKALVQDLRGMAGMMDDRDERIVYSSGWSQWSESGLYQETSTFIESPTGNETAKFQFSGTGIEVYATVHSDRGIAEIWIDGEYVGDADSYAASKSNYTKIFEKADLENKEHTLELKVANRKNAASSKTKFELDAFKILDKTTSVNGVTVSAKGGIHTLAVAESQLQMQAQVDTQAGNRKVTWQVTDVNGMATDLAQIDENGLLTIGDVSGVVRVTAASVLNPSVSGFMDIHIALPDGAPALVSEIVEFTASVDGSLVQNPDFTFEGSGWGTWPEIGCYNDSKIDAFHAGSQVSYTFTGSGVELYAPSNINYGTVEIYIDGNLEETVNMNGNDVKIVKHFSKMDLSNSQHTIKCVVTAADAGGAAIAGFDYLEIFRPDPDSVPLADKSELQEIILSNAENYEEKYTKDSWEPYAEAYQAAVEVMNDSGADDAAVETAVRSLAAAAADLVEKENPPRPDASGRKVSILNTESASVVVRWEAVETAVNYTVYVNGEAVGETAECAYKILGLSHGTEYTILVEAANRIGGTDRFEEVKVSTNALPDVEAPSKVENLKLDGRNLTWRESEDNVGVAFYEIWLNGKWEAEVEEATYPLPELEPGLYTAAVYAVDDSGNRSIPASLTFQAEDRIPETVTIESVDICTPVSVAYGTTFGNLKLPTSVRVNLSNGEKKEAAVTWNQAEYSETKTGTQKISGVLGAVEGAENSRGIKAYIEVTVGAAPVQKPDDPVKEEKAPEAVKAFRQKAQSTTWITLSWGKSADADGYLLYRYDAKRKKSELIQNIASASTQSYKIKKLKKATNYTFQIIPYKNAEGKRLMGPAASLKTSTATKAPTVKVEKCSSKAVRIKWKKIKGCSGYEIAMSQKKTKNYKVIKTMKKVSAVKFDKKKGLKKGKTYYFKVRTYRKAGGKKVYSAYSKVRRIKL